MFFTTINITLNFLNFISAGIPLECCTKCLNQTAYFWSPFASIKIGCFLEQFKNFLPQMKYFIAKVFGMSMSWQRRKLTTHASEAGVLTN